MFYSLQKQRKHSEERSFGRFKMSLKCDRVQPGKIWLIFELHIGKSIRPKGFESIKPTFRILSLYTKTGVSLITAGYRRLPQGTAGSLILSFSMEFIILLHGIGII